MLLDVITRLLSWKKSTPLPFNAPSGLELYGLPFILLHFLRVFDLPWHAGRGRVVRGIFHSRYPSFLFTHKLICLKKTAAILFSFFTKIQHKKLSRAIMWIVRKPLLWTLLYSKNGLQLMEFICAFQIFVIFLRQNIYLSYHQMPWPGGYQIYQMQLWAIRWCQQDMTCWC